LEQSEGKRDEAQSSKSKHLPERRQWIKSKH